MNATGLNRLDLLLREKVEEAQEVPGAVVLVRGPGGIAFCGAYGLRQRIPISLPMTRETVFDIASLTKSVCTSLLTMIMTQRGRLNLDQSLEAWFGHLEDPAKRGITVRQLLSNRSGLPAWRPYYREYREDRQPIAVEEMVRTVLAEPLEAPTGTREVYSDLGFILLGSILERVSGLPLDQLFQMEIAEPLGLRHTGYRRWGGLRRWPAQEGEAIAATENCPWTRRILAGEVHDENCYLVGGVAGHAGLFATAAELDRIVVEIFEGLLGSSTLFSSVSVRTFFQRQDTGAKGTWALGWDTPSETNSAAGRYCSGNTFGHNGFTGTSLWIDFDRRTAVVFLTNRVHPSRQNTAIRWLRPQFHDSVFGQLPLEQIRT
jgi:serine-type D-Ala-D-Ala carboxypeptidase